MIPKRIHYFWFGGNEKPELVKKCIKSWEKNLNGYEIIEWNENNYDVNKHPFLKKAYKNKKWAFVSDYARLDILNQWGGIFRY
jgi:mannosyltransferase OCH1-like enzyme